MQRIYTTKKCHEFGHPNFSLVIDPDGIPEELISSLLNAIDDAVASGRKLQADEMYQFGWIATVIKPYQDGTLTLHEPDMKSFPIQLVPRVTQSIQHMMVQLFTLESYEVSRDDMVIPSVRDSAFLCSCFETTPTLVLERSSPCDGNDSGWHFGCGRCDEGIKRVSLYEALLKRSEIKYWVTFPIETRIALSPKAPPGVSRSGLQMRLVEDSFQARRFNEVVSEADQ